MSATTPSRYGNSRPAPMGHYASTYLIIYYKK